GMEVSGGQPIATNRIQPSFLTGCIQITGAWNGAVTVDCAGDLARSIAAIMFDVPLEETMPDQVNDALGEMTNIIGGNFKSFLPEPSQLSLPSVAEGTDYFFRIIGSRQLAQFNFSCQGLPFQVTIVEGKR